MILETLFDIFSKIIRNIVYFFKFCLKIPPAPPSAAPQGAAAPWEGGIFKQNSKKYTIFRNIFENMSNNVYKIIPNRIFNASKF